MFEPLAARDFRLLWIGQTVSMFGDGVFTVALAWQAYALTGSPGTLAAVLLAKAIPMVVLMLLSGVLTDRVERRSLLLWSDAVRAVAGGLIALLSLSGSLETWHLIVLGAIFGAADAFFQPAFTAIVPDVVTPALLPQANSLQAASRILGFQLVGPAIGGILVAAIGPGWAFAIDASTFVIAFVAALLMRRVPAAGRSGAGLIAEVMEGIRYTRTQRWLWVLLLAAAFVVFAIDGPFDVLAPLVVKERLGGGAREYGIIVAAMGVGGILAAAWLGQRGLPRRRVTWMYLIWAVSCLGIIGIALSTTVAVAVVTAALTGVCFEVGLVIWNTLLQERVPRRLLGRVSSLDWMLSLSLTPLSYAVAGPLGVAFGAVPVLVAGGVLGFVLLLGAYFVPGVRDPDRTPPPADQPAPAGEEDSNANMRSGSSRT